MRFGLKLIILALSLASTGAWAANGGYRDLPGVKSPEQRAAEKTGPDCSTHIQLRYYYGRRRLPVRVYDCSEGNVTYESNMPPLYQRRPADPYIHGEGPINPPGTLN